MQPAILGGFNSFWRSGVGRPRHEPLLHRRLARSRALGGQLEPEPPRLLLEDAFPAGADTAPTDAGDVEIGRFSRCPLRATARNWPECNSSGPNATTTAACARASFASEAHRVFGSESRPRSSWVRENLRATLGCLTISAKFLGV